jgi:hypothetical protein
MDHSGRIEDKEDSKITYQSPDDYDAHRFFKRILGLANRVGNLDRDFLDSEERISDMLSKFFDLTQKLKDQQLEIDDLYRIIGDLLEKNKG